MIYILKMLISQSYVKLQEGNPTCPVCSILKPGCCSWYKVAMRRINHFSHVTVNLALWSFLSEFHHRRSSFNPQNSYVGVQQPPRLLEWNCTDCSCFVCVCSCAIPVCGGQNHKKKNITLW